MSARPSLDSTPVSGAARGRQPSPWILLLGVLMALAAPVAASLAVPQFLPVFVNFGAELPGLTLLLVNHHVLLWLLPVLALAVGALAHVRRWGAGPPLMIGLASLGLVPVLVYSLYLPIFMLGAAG